MSAQGKADDKQGAFTVTDRRIFADEQGTARVEETPQPPADGAKPGPAVPPGGAPAIDFHTFVLSLGSSALLHLGELERPGEGGPQPNLEMAKHTIDILGMLQEKTRGNLT